MKKKTILFFNGGMMRNTLIAFTIILGLFCAGCEDTDIDMAARAGMDAVRAITLDDGEVARLAVNLSMQSDQNHTIAPPENEYAKRLQKLVGDHQKAHSVEFNYKVYLSPTVNAFAMADGTVRIYSGLMDMLDDRQLLFVLGHEMGHIVEKHIKKKIMLAYAGSAVRKGIASQNNVAGEIARSGIGTLAETLLNAQFSQQEEREADDFGVSFLTQQGLDRRPAISALMKLSTLGNTHSFLSSHPSPEARAKRLQNDRAVPEKTPALTFLKSILNWLKTYWPADDARPQQPAKCNPRGVPLHRQAVSV